MSDHTKNRGRRAKIIATIGPASRDLDIISALFEAGADVFRLNFSHGSHEDHAASIAAIRGVEKARNQPIAILMDLQGPKLRVGIFQDSKVVLQTGSTFRLDLDPRPGNAKRVCLPHPEVFAALIPDAALLVDDGHLRLHVKACGKDFAETEVVSGGSISAELLMTILAKDTDRALG